MTRANVLISVASDGTVKVKKDIEGIGDSAKDASQSMDMLKQVLATVISVQTLRTFANITSEFTDYKARVDLATDGTINAADAMEKLFEISQDTYSTFDQTAETFLRNSTALSSLGVSTQDVMTYTEALNTALVVSGAKGDEAARAMEALSKGMTTGRLEVENLQTIMNSSSRVTELLAKELGVLPGELMKLENRSRITGQVIYNSLVGNLDILKEELETMPTTINDGLMRIANSFNFLIGSMDQTIGASAALADVLVWVADNLQLVLIAVSPLAAALTILGVQIVGTMLINAFMTFTAAIVASGKAIMGLFTLLMAHPLVAIGVAISALIVYFVGWQEVIEKLIYLWGKLKEAIGIALEALGYGTTWAADGLQIQVNAKEAAKDLSDAINGGAKRLAEGVDVGSKAGADKLRKGVEDGAARGARLLAEAQDRAVARYESMNGKAIKELGNTLTKGGDYMYNQVTGSVTKAAPAHTKAIEKGGKTAASDIEQSMVRGGDAAASSFEAAGVKIAGELAHVFYNQIEQLISVQSSFVQAQADLLFAQAAAIREGRGIDGTGGNTGGVPPMGSGFKEGTRDIVTEWGPLQTEIARQRAEHQKYLKEMENRVTGNNQPVNTGTVSTAQKSGGGGVTVNNYTDPGALVNYMDTAQGRQVITNVIKQERNEIRNILGY